MDERFVDPLTTDEPPTSCRRPTHFGVLDTLPPDVLKDNIKALEAELLAARWMLEMMYIAAGNVDSGYFTKYIATLRERTNGNG